MISTYIMEGVATIKHRIIQSVKVVESSIPSAILTGTVSDPRIKN